MCLGIIYFLFFPQTESRDRLIVNLMFGCFGTIIFAWILSQRPLLRVFLAIHVGLLIDILFAVIFNMITKLFILF